MRKIYFLIFIVLLSSCSKSESNVNLQNESFADAVDRYLGSLSESNKFMGSVSVTNNGNQIYNRAFGYRDIEKQQFNVSNTLFRIGSITKTFTAVLIVQLVEEGLLSFEDKLSLYYPEIPNAELITIDMMLHHQSGIYDLTSHPDYIEYFNIPKTKQEILDILITYAPAFEPETNVEYSNTNFILLGYIIESITGKSYDTNIQERIAGNAGLVNTFYGSEINTINNESKSYRFINGNWELAPETHMSIPHGAGALVSSSSELISFINSLFENELVSETSIRDMLVPSSGYGRGIIVVPYENKLVYGHSGIINGFRNVMIYIPEDKIALVYLSNGLNYSQRDLWTEILDIYYELNP